MKKIISEKIMRIIKSRKKLEKELEVKITNRGKEVYLEGSPENEYTAEKVIEAIGFGFPISTAILIKKDDLLFEIINIKEHTNKKNLERVRGRIIGTGGKTLKTLSNLSDSFLEIKDNEIGVIANPENVKIANEAITSIIKGSKQSNMYAFLEKNRAKPIGDLGLKEK